MLASCLLLGCSASSFVYRRQEGNPFQPIIFLVSIVVAVVVGYCAGASPNFILLGYVPWAVDAAMLMSICVQAIAGMQRSPKEQISCLEKGGTRTAWSGTKTPSCCLGSRTIFEDSVTNYIDQEGVDGSIRSKRLNTLFSLVVGTQPSTPSRS